MGISSKCPTIASCCCGCTLRTGTLILAWLNVIGSALALVSVGPYFGVLDKNNPDYILVLTILIVVTVLYGFQFVIGVILLIGATKNKSGYILPYLWLAAILLGIGLAMVILAFIVSPLIYGLPMTFEWLLGFYFFMVVNSFYQQLKGSYAKTDIQALIEVS